MAFQKTPGGTRGPKGMRKANAAVKFVQRMMMRQHRRKGDRFQGMDLLYLTTIGARSGQTLVTPVAFFGDGADAWLIVASAGGAAHHPSWYHNLAAHPDQVSAEVGGQRISVTPTQLAGSERDAAWQRITEAQPRFSGYQKKTDRVLPVIRLTRAS
jgi:deazaflavin-dependent oxidoreductase (nitroreductase family)